MKHHGANIKNNHQSNNSFLQKPSSKPSSSIQSQKEDMMTTKNISEDIDEHIDILDDIPTLDSVADMDHMQEIVNLERQELPSLKQLVRFFELPLLEFY
jgi:hypothetical protein